MIREDYKNEIINEYFDWIFNIICDGKYAKSISYKKLISHLHGTTFKCVMPKDTNRIDDGINLRWKFAYDIGRDRDFEVIEECLYGPCSVLEMMVALSIRCEDTIMDDTRFGNRTKQWFWGMIASLGLGSMTDDQFDKRYVDSVLERFMNREYEPNGKGGLFTIRNTNQDLRKVDIWCQLCWYLDSIL